MGCANLTNPISVLCYDHNSCGAVFSRVSCSIVSDIWMGVLSLSMTFSINPSLHAHNDILMYVYLVKYICTYSWWVSNPVLAVLL